MELEAYVLASQGSSPGYVLANTVDVCRLLYSELHNEWLWQYLHAQALKVSTSIFVQSFPIGQNLLDRVRTHVLSALRTPSNPCEAILHIKVLVALITRNSVRFTSDNFNELYKILENLISQTSKRLIELIFYTLMILLSLYDDYSSILSLKSILTPISACAEGRRLLYALESRDGKWATILQEMNDCFGFDLKMPETCVEKSAKSIISCKHGEKLEVEEMDDKCLAAYVGRGGKQISMEALVNCFIHSTDAHFINLIETVVERLQIHICEHHLLEVLNKHSNLSYRVLFYVLFFNEKVHSHGYSFDFMFEVDVRKSLRQAHKQILEKLLHLINEHLPWFFISSLAESSVPSQVSDSFIFSFVHSLPNVTAEQMMQWKQLLAYHPLKVTLSTLDIIEPLRTMAPQDLLNPLRVFNCISLHDPNSIE